MSITNVPFFRPTSITGCSLWFDGTDSSTITLSSGSLTQWNDKSGNGKNFTAVSGYANATVSSAYQNGLNVFNFSGNGLYRTPEGSAVYPQDAYIIVALKSTTAHVDVLGMGDRAVDNFNSLTFAESAVSKWHNGSSGGARQTISDTTETSTSFLLMQWSIANGNYLLRRNGTQLVQASRTYSFSTPSTAIFQIGYRHTDNVYGPGANFSGYIGEIAVFNSQLGTTDRQNIESYFAQKWGLTAGLPAGHPGLTSTVYKSPTQAIQVTPYTSVSHAFAPTQISGCQLWLDAQDNSVISLTSGRVSTVTDKALGTTFTSVGSTPANLTVASASINSFQSFYFNNSAGNYAGLRGNLAQLTTGTAIFVMKYISSQNGPWRGIFGWNDTTTVQSISFGMNLNGTGTVGPYVQNIGYNGTATATLTDNGLYIVTFTFTGTTTGVGYNGQISLTAGTVSSYSGSSTSIGICTETNGTQMTAVYLGELIIYNTVLGATDRQKVESYLAQKWGIRSSLAATHPGLTINYFLHQYMVTRGAITTLTPAILQLKYTVSGLQFHLDAGNLSSYPRSGSTWYDLAGSGLTTTLYGSPTYSSENGGSILFVPSSSQYAQTSASLSALSNWSLEVWLYYTNTNSAGSPCIICPVYTGTPINFVLGNRSDSQYGLIAGYFNGGWYSTRTDYSLPSVGWYHIVGTYDGTNLKLYVNNSLIDTTASATASSSGGNPIRFMRRWDVGHYWGGYLSIVRIYNRALSLSEIGVNYNGSRQRFLLT